MVRGISPSIAQSHYADAALKRLKTFGGMNIGHKLAIKAKSSNGKLSGEIHWNVSKRWNKKIKIDGSSVTPKY